MDKGHHAEIIPKTKQIIIVVYYTELMLFIGKTVLRVLYEYDGLLCTHSPFK